VTSGTVGNGVVGLSVGQAHSEIIGPNPAMPPNGVSGWGLNTSGQIGDGTATSRPTPTRSPTL
jgi:hypothetical protein